MNDKAKTIARKDKPVGDPHKEGRQFAKDTTFRGGGDPQQDMRVKLRRRDRMNDTIDRST